MKSPFIQISLILCLALAACGPRKNMEGAGSDTEVAETTDSSVSEENKSEATGQGDTTTFTDGEEVEKVDVYTVHRGDNLWDIAGKRSVYSSGWLYPLIVKANKDKIKDANDLANGITLTIPRGLPAADYDIAREEAMAGVWEGPNAGLKEGGSSRPAAYTESKKGAQGGAQAGKKGGGGSLWIWLLLLALIAGLGWAWFKMKSKKDSDADSESPAAA